jgi:hypothetical protein
MAVVVVVLMVMELLTLLLELLVQAVVEVVLDGQELQAPQVKVMQVVQEHSLAVVGVVVLAA